MSLNQFEIFCTVAEEKSLTKAAKKLHISQPAVSGQIKAMETHYELCLFERTNQGVVLTPAGEIVYQYAQQLLHIHEDMEKSLVALASSKPCQLVVGASTVVGGYPLPCTVWLFKERHPTANIKLEVASSADILEKVKTAALDLAIIEGPVDDEHVVVKPCAKDEMVLVTPYTEPWTAMKEITFEELKGLPLILREKGSGMRAIFETGLEKIGASLEDLQIFTEMGNLGAIKSSVEAGHGVAIIPKITVRKELYTKILKALPVKDLDLTLNYKVIYHEKQILSDIAKTFIRLVTNPEERAFC